MFVGSMHSHVRVDGYKPIAGVEVADCFVFFDVWVIAAVRIHLSEVF